MNWLVLEYPGNHRRVGGRRFKDASMMTRMKSATMRISFAFVLCMMPLSGCIMFNAEDVIVAEGATIPAAHADDSELPADQVRLFAYLERRFWLCTSGKVSGKKVEFRRDGKLLGSAMTDDSGRAVLVCKRGSEPWRYSARVECSGERISEGTVFVWPADRPVVVFDLDDTLLKSKYAGMVFQLKDSSPPMPLARETVEELSRDYSIVYLTVRARVFREMTRTWLAKHEFLPFPTTYAIDFSYYTKQKEARVDIIKRIQRNGFTIVAGIGDKDADELALHECGIPRMIVRPGYKAQCSDTILLNGLADVPDTVRRLKTTTMQK